MLRRQVIAGLGGLAAVAHAGCSRAQPVGRLDDDEARALLALIPFPRIQVNGRRALAEWTRLRSEGAGWPIITGPTEEIDLLVEQMTAFGEEVADPNETLRKADKLRAPKSIVDLRTAEWADAEDQAYVAHYIGQPGDDLKSKAPDEPWGVRDLRGEHYEAVHILTLPAKTSAEAIAQLNFGAWNACPPPEHHAALLRHWSERYGAELVQVGGDTISLKVARRPATQEEALEVALTQYHYCPDVLEQGYETLATLASVLRRTDWWLFWWD